MSKDLFTAKKIKVATFLAVTILFLAFSPGKAQNTKGDKPQNAQKPFFRLPKILSKKKGGDKAYTRDISGRRRIRTKNKSSAGRAIQTKQSPFASRGPTGGDRPYKRPSWKANRLLSRTAQASRNNVYPSRDQFAKNPSPFPHDKQRAYNNQKILERAIGLSTKPKPPGRKKVIVARTASRSYVTRGRKNVYWGKFRKGEKPITTDIAGQPLRAKNFHTPGLGVLPAPTVYKRKRKTGDQPYKGTFTSGYVTSPKVSKPWKGNISGHAIRTKPPKVSQHAGKMFEPRNYSATKRGEIAAKPFREVSRSASGRISNKPIQPKAPGIGGISLERLLSRSRGKRAPRGGYVTSKGGFNNKGRPIDSKLPGAGARFVDIYQGYYKAQRPVKGGGTRTKGWNNSGRPLIAKSFMLPGYSYSGNMKSIRPPKGGGSISNKRWNNSGRPIDSKGPGIGGRFVDIYQGNYKGTKPVKGGGSVSGKLWNNGNMPVGAKAPYGIQAKYVDRYQGFVKASRTPKGGGSISGKLWNNRNQPIGGKMPYGIQAKYVDRYQGFFKASRTPKGGGSISGRLWNNGNTPISGKAPTGIQAKYVDRYQGFIRRIDAVKVFTPGGADYSGDIKAHKPLKGGGSVSGKLWNNKERPIEGRSVSPSALKIGGYSGDIKGYRPPKGGGSVSGKLWNNKERPIEGKSVSPAALKIGGYAGDIKARRPEKGGGSISGKLWNNKEKPIEGKAYSPSSLKISAYPGDHKLKRSEKYIHNPNTKETALKKQRPDKTTYLVNNLQIKTKAREYEHNKLSAKSALKGESNGKNSLKAIEYSSRIKVLWTKTFQPGKSLNGRTPMQKYVHAPNSKKGALMVHEPGRAYARIKDLQVNVKMTKPHGRNLHPDSKYANSLRDNVKKERTFLMNLKLKWAKLFKKNDTQPQAVKERVHRPRYDKKERELWKDLYD